MAKQQSQDGTPTVGEEGNFFADFMPDEDSGLLVEDDASGEEDDDSEGDPPPGEAQDGDDDEGADEGGDGDDEGADDDDGAGDDSDDDAGADDEGADDDDDAGSDDDQGGQDDDGDDDGEGANLTTTMNSFVENGVLDVVDEEKEYTADEAGFQELINDTVENRLQARLKENNDSRREEVRELETFLETYPEATVEDFLNDQEDFDYNTVDESDPQNQLYLLQDYYEMQGYSKEETLATLKEHQAAKSIGRHAKKAKAALIKEQEKTVAAKQQAREQAQKQREAQVAENRRQFEQKVLKTEKVGGILLNVKERQKLADYILKPIDDSGKTQAELDTDNEESELLLAYLRMNKIDLTKLSQKAETRATLKFKKKIDKHTDTLAKPKKTRKDPNVVAEPDDLSGLDSWQM